MLCLFIVGDDGQQNVNTHIAHYTGPTVLTANYPPTVGFMNASILAGPHGGTLRRVREYDSTPPRILSKIDVDPQYYYG